MQWRLETYLVLFSVCLSVFLFRVGISDKSHPQCPFLVSKDPVFINSGFYKERILTASTHDLCKFPDYKHLTQVLSILDSMSGLFCRFGLSCQIICHFQQSFLHFQVKWLSIPFTMESLFHSAALKSLTPFQPSPITEK